MKQFIIILAYMASSVVAAQAQPFQYRENERDIKDDFPHLWHPLTAFQKSTQSNVMLPLEGLYYYGEISGCPYDTAIGPITYKYHDNGMLKEIYCDVFPHIWGFEAMKQEYNGTFVMEGRNMVDTTTYYRISDGVYTPYGRFYYNYHYYDKFETDSFFYERVVQQWNPANKNWTNDSKRYVGYVDTILWNNTRSTRFTGTESGWEPEALFLDSLVYDERGFVVARFSFEDYIGIGTRRIKYEYYLNEDGSIYAMDVFLYRNDEWEWLRKRTNIIWALWLGYGGYDISRFVGRDNIPINGKRNKLTSETQWDRDSIDDEWEWTSIRKKYWDLDDYDSNTDTLFYSLDGGETLYPYDAQTYRFDKYGNETEMSYVFWKEPDKEGNQLINAGNRSKIRYSYNEMGWYKLEQWVELYNTKTHQWDSLTAYKEEVTKWGDPFNSISELPPNENQLIIAPNPASGAITISAASEIQQLQIFDIVGRLIHNQTPTSKEVVFDTGILAKGIYLVRVLLRDGAVQRGKVVKD